MASVRHYASLPNPRTNPDAAREMDDAFDDDNDDHRETAPLTLHQAPSPVSAEPPPSRSGSQLMPLSNPYDFERDYYDLPPPGSPPSPSTFALPNNYGNSNGHLPTSPIASLPPQRQSIFRRTFGAWFPAWPYQPVMSRDGRRPRGGGTDNDGVFANVAAKPASSVSVTTDNGDVYMLPEETQEEAPPV
jgi:hypothetical protein